MHNMLMITFSGLRNLLEDFGVSGGDGDGGRYLGGLGGLGDFAIFTDGGDNEIIGCGGKMIGTGGDKIGTGCDKIE